MDPLHDLQQQLGELEDHPSPRTPPPPPNVTLTCPKCFKKITVVKKHLGLVLECSLCGHHFRGSLRKESKLQARLTGEADKKRLTSRTAALLVKLRRKKYSPTATGSGNSVGEESSAQLDTLLIAPGIEVQPTSLPRKPEHGWPFDNRQHPSGWPIHWYWKYWLVLAGITLACRAIMLYSRISPWGLDSEDMSMIQYALSWSIWVLYWIFAVATVLCWSGNVGAVVSHGKGRPHREGFIFGFFLGPLGWILAGLMPNHPDSS